MTMRFFRPIAFSALVTLGFGTLARADTIIDWNNAALNAIRAAKTPPPVASRALAMTHIAMFDAVNAVDGGYQSYAYSGTAAPGTSDAAAAAQSAYHVLSDLFPAQQTTFQTLLNNQLAALPDSAGKTAGILLGDNAAQGMLGLRANDGSVNTLPAYMGSTAVGQWRPTSPGTSGLLPNWPAVTPFALGSGSQFRQGPPPALTSTQYAADLNEVKSLGSKNSTTRTADQTQIALFWADGGGTATPPGHWNRIAQTVSVSQHNTLAQNARMFALLNIGLADAGIAAWDMKYTYNCWRPVTAIQNADLDGNPNTVVDPKWQPLITTPNFSSYSSGHSAFSAAASTILSDFYGTDNVAFDAVSDDGTTIRSFGSFSQASKEAGLSRIYGGIHFGFDNVASAEIGANVGTFAFNNRLAPVPEPGSVALLAGFACAGIGLLRKRRR